jgi:hypothetical protein
VLSYAVSVGDVALLAVVAVLSMIWFYVWYIR